MDMSGNTILITGGTSGIGLGLAERLQAEGNTVIVAGRREKALAAIVAQHPGMDSVVMDVADPASITRSVATVIDRHPEVNVVINNAGIMQPEDLLDPRHLEIAELTVATNLLGPVRVLTAIIPHLMTRPSATIINVSSGLAFVPLPATPTYSATKAALHSYTESLRVQLAATGVDVLELIPPAVQTDLMDQAARGQGMALSDFLTEAIGILRDDPDAVEICVNDVLFLRNAEVDGTRDRVLAVLTGAHS